MPECGPAPAAAIPGTTPDQPVIADAGAARCRAVSPRRGPPVDIHSAFQSIPFGGSVKGGDRAGAARTKGVIRGRLLSVGLARW